MRDVPTARWRPLSPAERAVAIEVLRHGPSSRSEIARRLGMSGGSITRLAKPLIDAGLLTERSGPAPVTGQGRPGRPLDIVTDPWHFVGLKVTADTVYGVVTTLKSTVVRRASSPLPARDPDTVAETAHAVIAGFAEEYPRLAGVGAGIGGRVRDRAVVAESPYLDWEEVPFAELLAERTGLPVVLENDVVALTESETWFGAGRGLDRFVVLTIGAGVGYGLVIGGRQVRGAHDGRRTPEHWILDPSGPLGPDGRRGSAGALLTIPAVERQVRAATGGDADYEDILARARRAEPVAARVVGEAARGLGVLLAQIANFVMPQKILLAGEGVGLVDVAGGVVTDTIAAHRHPLAEPVPLETKVSDFHDWARGAAVLAIQVLVLGGTGGGTGEGTGGRPDA
ncbi:MULTISPECIES: ROK family transcriptional regulator [Streptomyces]|uniref:ROK family transcriptional regulator n=1 Tax=Streptomyces TaxID=1883 RepID=UPI001F385705|nr:MULTISPECIES: ROK family transcriptional regulator [Streptomyces]